MTTLLEIAAPTIEYGLLGPVLIVFAGACLGVLIEALMPRHLRDVVQLIVTGLSLLGALVVLWLTWGPGQRRVGAMGAVSVDGPTQIIWLLILIFALLSALLFAERKLAGGVTSFTPMAAAVPNSPLERDAARARLEHTEVFPLMLFAVTGMLLFPAANDLLTMFVALEVLSLPLYLLSGLARYRRLLSHEAALKYFLLGSLSSAIFLFGAALLYGYSGSFTFAAIDAAVTTPSEHDALLVAGMVLLLVGLLFKIGAVPFHSWTPDVYQGAPTPITGFMAACTKAAAFGALLRVMYVVVPAVVWDLRPALWAIVILTMAVGVLVALVQTDIKRILAYSAIAHTGFILTGVVALERSGITAVLFYLLAYGTAAVGTFAIVTLVREVDADGVVLGEATHLSQWAGLGKQHPWLAGAFSLFLLSFAGIPLTAGFIAKFTAFSSAVQGGATPLAVAGVVASAVAVFFYIRIIVLMFLTDAPHAGEGASVTVVRSEGLTTVAIAVAAAATVLLGVAPQPVLDLMGEAAKFIP